MTAPDAGYTPDPALVDLIMCAWFDAEPCGHWAEHRPVPEPCSSCSAASVAAAIAATGRLLPADARKLDEQWSVRVTLESGESYIPADEGEPVMHRESAERIAVDARLFPVVRAADAVTREAWVTPWLPAPTNTEES